MFRNKGHTRTPPPEGRPWDPTALRLTTNVNQNIEEYTEEALILCQATPQVVFHLGIPEFSPNVLTDREECPSLLACAETSHAYQAPNKTATPDTATPAAVGISKRNSNHAQPTEGQAAPPRLSANPDSDITPSASFVESDDNSGYAKSNGNSPTSLAIMTDLEVQISELETMHEVSEGDIDTLVPLTVIFTHTNKLETMDLVNSKTDPTKNHQDNDSTPPLSTQPHLPQSPLKDTLVTLDNPPPRPHVEAGDTSVLARTGDLPYVRLWGAGNMLFGVYQDWVNQILETIYKSESQRMV